MGRDRERRGSPAFRRAEELLALPEGTLGRCTRMEWTDCRRVLVDGCCGILEYDEDQVLVRTVGGTVLFRGQGLQLQCLSPDSIFLTGRIRQVEFGEVEP